MNNKYNIRDEQSCNIIKKTRYNVKSEIPIIKDYNNFNNNKHSLISLKTISKFYKLKLTGNKDK